MESLFEKLLRERLLLMMDIRVQRMTITGETDFAEYKHNFGYIEAIRNVLDAIEEVQTEMRKE